MSFTDQPTAYLNPYDDILQMIASLEHRDAGDERMATKLASGLEPARQVVALTNIARVLASLLQAERADGGAKVFEDVRKSMIAQIVSCPTD